MPRILFALSIVCFAISGATGVFAETHFQKQDSFDATKRPMGNLTCGDFGSGKVECRTPIAHPALAVTR